MLDQLDHWYPLVNELDESSGINTIIVRHSPLISSIPLPQILRRKFNGCIFHPQTIANGSAIGDIEPAYMTAMKQSIDSIFKDYGAVQTIINRYTLYAELLETLPHLTRGQAAIEQTERFALLRQRTIIYSSRY